MMERLNGWNVVALWGAFNAFFVLLFVGFILGGFGSSVFALETYCAATALVFAFTALTVWLGLAFGIWIAVLAAFPFLWAVLIEYSIHQRRRG